MAQTQRGRPGFLSVNAAFSDAADFPRAAPRRSSAKSGGASQAASRRAPAQYAPFASSFPSSPAAFSPAAVAGEVRRREKLAQRARGAARPEPDSEVCAPQSGEHLERLARPVEAETVSPGSLLLGIVAEVHTSELIVHLPFGMMGCVPRSQTQEESTPSFASARVCGEGLGDASEVPGARDGKPHAQTFLPLSRSHYVGQVVQTVVLGGGKEGREEEGDWRRHSQNSRVLLLSLRPSLFNAGLSANSLAPGMVVPATVAAVEEHGYMLSFGVDSLSGFLPFAELATGSAAAPERNVDTDAALPLHSVLSVRVAKVSKAAKVIICALPGEQETAETLETPEAPRGESQKKQKTTAADSREAASSGGQSPGNSTRTPEVPASLKTSLDWSSIKPGLLVQAKVTQLIRQRDLTAETTRTEKKRRGDADRERSSEDEVRALTVTCLNGVPGVVHQTHAVTHAVTHAAPAGGAKASKAASTTAAALHASAESAEPGESLDALLEQLASHVDSLQGRVVAGRIVGVFPDARRVHICLLPHVVSWKSKILPPHVARPGALLRGPAAVLHSPLSPTGDLRAVLAVGDDLADEETPAGGEAMHLVVRIPARFRAHAHAAQKKKAGRTAAALSPGAPLAPEAAECRVLFEDRFLGEVVAANAPPVVKEKLLTPCDLKAGDFVLGTVTKILWGRAEAADRHSKATNSHDGVVVSLSPHLSAFVPLYQLSDIPLSTMPAFVSIGATLKLRVLSRVCCASCSALDGPICNNFFYFFNPALPLPGAADAYALARRRGSRLMEAGGGGRVRLFLTAKKSFLQPAEQPLFFLTKDVQCFAKDMLHARLEGGKGDTLACAPAGGLVEGAVVSAYIGEVKAARSKAREGSDLPFVSLAFLGGLKAQLTKEQVAQAVQEGRSLSVGALLKVRILSVNCERRSFRVSLDLDGSKSETSGILRSPTLLTAKTGSYVRRRNACVLAVTEEGVFVAVRSFSSADAEPSSSELSGSADDAQQGKKSRRERKRERSAEEGRTENIAVAFVPKLHLSDDVRLAEELCTLVKVGEDLPMDAVLLSPGAAVRPGAPVRLWRGEKAATASVAQMANALAQELEHSDADRVVRDVCLLSCKPSLRNSVANGTFVTGSSSLLALAGASTGKPRVTFGYVRRVGAFGLLVSFGAWQLTGLVPHSYISDAFVEGESLLHRLYREGMTVRACVASVHKKTESGTQPTVSESGEAGHVSAASAANDESGESGESGEKRRKPLQFVVDIRPRRLSVLQKQETAGEAETKRGRSPGLGLLSALLDQREFASRLGGTSKGKAESACAGRVWGQQKPRFHSGQLVEGCVTQVLPNCLLVALESPEKALEGGDAEEAKNTGVVLEHQLPEGETIERLSERQAAEVAKTGRGLKMNFVALDVDEITGIIDLSARRRLVEPLTKVRKALDEAAAAGRVYAYFTLHGPMHAKQEAPAESKKNGLHVGKAEEFSEMLPSCFSDLKKGKKQKRSRASATSGDLSAEASVDAWDLSRDLFPPRVFARMQELCAATPPVSAEVQLENASYAVLATDFSLSLSTSTSPTPPAKPSLSVTLPVFLFSLSCRNNTLQPCQLSASAFEVSGSAQATSAATVALSPLVTRHATSGVLLADCCWERHHQARIEAQQKRTRGKDRFVRDQLQKVLRGENLGFARGSGAVGPAVGLRGLGLSSVADVEKELTVGKVLRCRVTSLGATVALARLKSPKKALLIRLHAANAVGEEARGRRAGEAPFQGLRPGSIAEVRVLRLSRCAGEGKTEPQRGKGGKAGQVGESASDDEQGVEVTKNEWVADVELVQPRQERASGGDMEGDPDVQRKSEGKRKRPETDDECRWAVVEQVGPRCLKIHCGVRRGPSAEAASTLAKSLKKRRLAGEAAGPLPEAASPEFVEERGRIEWGDIRRDAGKEAPEKQFRVGELLLVRPHPIVACTRDMFEEALAKFVKTKEDDGETRGRGPREPAGRTLLRGYTIVDAEDGEKKQTQRDLCTTTVPRSLSQVFTSLPNAVSAWAAWQFPPNAVCWGVVHHFLSAPFAVAVQLSSVSLSPRDPSNSSSSSLTSAADLVQVPVLAAVHLVELTDEWVSDPLKRLDLKVGQSVKVKVLPVATPSENKSRRTEDKKEVESRSGLPLEASLRLSRVEAKEGLTRLHRAAKDLRGDDMRFEHLEVGQLVSGWVVSSGQAGVFVALSRSLTLRIKLQKLLPHSAFAPEAGASDPAASGRVPVRLVSGEEAKALFPVGRVLEGIRIVVLDPESKRIEGSLRHSSVKRREDENGDETKSGSAREDARREGSEAGETEKVESQKKRQGSNRLLEKLKVGDVVDGRVRGLESFGVFVRLEDGEEGDEDRSALDVLCHVSEMGGKDWGNKRARLQRLQKGDLVKARVTKIDRAQGKAWISLDADVFEDDSEEEEEGFGVSQDSSEEDATGENDDSRSIENAEWGREEQAVDVDVQVEKPRKKNAKNKRMGESEEESPENDGDFSTDEGEETGGSWSAGLSAGDTWGWTETGPSEDNGTSRREGFVSDSEGEDPPELSDVEESEEKRSKAARRRHEEEARRNEEDTRRLEDNAGRSWMEDPRSPEDFERLVLVNGNSAAVWISYMAYYLKLNELQLARQIAERAVQHINYREEQERSSVWIAYLNLECVYGDRVDDVFRRAIQYNDSKKIHYQMTFIYEKARQLDKARQMCEKCCEKFPESQKMWVRHLTLLYTALDAASAARDLMLQALFRLPRRKHIEFVATCARLEYKHASKERGQTFFEKLLAEHPKRTDIWSQYVDAHIAAHTPPRCVPANLQSIRVLFERTTSLQLKLRKMKFFFTRWLDFEKQHGTAETQARVRAKAREFVQSVENKIRHTN
ncbi:pre-rRNA processing protein [Toxoplasma gondii p89]|uniref:Pre-rRNA processing protein n=1 Tax=Toxoplasma gondii p89 TaxID=943119 RepID=A0A086KET6_TOXGO|nr:pre-rRNA processing protein [Toxoplasma gondii p89]